MWNKSVNFEVIVICFLSLLPWPPRPGPFKLQCSRESARVVRKIVHTKWMPILEKYHVTLPLECPLHPMRDIFGPQQSAKKQHRPSQWNCGFCGKSFFEEKHLDMHFDSRHRTKMNVGEDSVCLADYCDLMRCEVLIIKDSTLTLGEQAFAPTDIEVWNEASAHRTAMLTAAKRDITPSKSNYIPHRYKEKMTDHLSGRKRKIEQSGCAGKRCRDDEGSGRESSGRDEEEDEEDEQKSNKNHSSSDQNVNPLPADELKHQKISEMQRMKANCKTDDIDKLKYKCESLVRDCIASLLVHLSSEDFKTLEDELNKAVCWYLTCDRYWEDGHEQRPFPWGLVLILIIVLSLGLCLCYYIIWVLFDESPNNHHNLLTAHSSSPYRHLPPQSSQFLQTTSITSSSSIPHGLNTNNYQQQQLKSSAQSLLIPSAGSSQPMHAMMSDQQVYTEEFFQANGGVEDMGNQEHYIYVSYPPEVKQHLLERYGREIYWLLKKDMYDSDED